VRGHLHWMPSGAATFEGPEWHASLGLTNKSRLRDVLGARLAGRVRRKERLKERRTIHKRDIKNQTQSDDLISRRPRELSVIIRQPWYASGYKFAHPPDPPSQQGLTEFSAIMSAPHKIRILSFPSNYKQTYSTLDMAPPTRLNPLRTPSPDPLDGHEATTRRKCKFYDALTNSKGAIPLNSISAKCGISEACGRLWKQQWMDMGSEAKRRLRPRSEILGRKSKVSKSICKMLCSPSRNPVRKQPYEAQIKYHNIAVGPRQLQRKMKEYTHGGGRYICAFIEKEISEKNRQQRTKFGNDHQFNALFGFFDHIVYTDEAHIDPSAQARTRVTRELGTRDLPENIEERPPLKGVKFHIAAWISWEAKAEKLIFYNDEEDYTERPPYPQKPRRRPTTESEEEYHHRVQEWEAGKPHDIEVKVKGNAMTQKYYVENLLPIYCEAIKSLQEIDDKPWLLQEDGDPSHGMRKRGLAQEYRDSYGIQNLSHPAQSPDLNPIEGIWAIIKQRLRQRVFDSEDELKKALQEEWDKITMKEIRDRIADLPRRCAELIRSGGGPIRGNKW
jgi:hypothetical protein